MKLLYKSLLISAMLATPFAAANAHESQAAHDAWVKAQDINVPPTLSIKTTTIPASAATSSDSSSGSSASSTSNGSMTTSTKE